MKLVKGLWGVFISSRRQGLEINVFFSGEPNLRYYKFYYMLSPYLFIWNVCSIFTAVLYHKWYYSECSHKSSAGIFKKLKRRTGSITKLVNRLTNSKQEFFYNDATHLSTQMQFLYACDRQHVIFNRHYSHVYQSNIISIRRWFILNTWRKFNFFMSRLFDPVNIMFVFNQYDLVFWLFRRLSGF